MPSHLIAAHYGTERAGYPTQSLCGNHVLLHMWHAPPPRRRYNHTTASAFFDYDCAGPLANVTPPGSAHACQGTGRHQVRLSAHSLANIGRTAAASAAPLSPLRQA